MKKIFFALFIIYYSGIQAQNITQWLALSPIKIEKPIFSNSKNVKDKLFTDEMLMDYMSLNIQDLRPDENKTENLFHKLRWTKAGMDNDTIIAPDTKGENTLNYYAVYLNNRDWLKGNLSFKIFGNAEIYIDGIKKTTVNGKKVTDKTIDNEWLPGKHTIIIKTISQGGKMLAAIFKADKDFEHIPVEFSLSPQRGKNINDVLNGKRVTRLDVSPNGKFCIAGITNIVDGENSSNTYVYNIDNKEIIYTFYGTNVSGLQWIPGSSCLSFLQKEGNSLSLYSYDLETMQQKCLIREDRKIKNSTWSPDASYLVYSDKENFADPKWELRKLDGIEDRQDYFRERSYLCKYDMATGLHSRIIWGNQSTYLMDISQDGEKLIFATEHPDYTAHPFSKQNIYLLDMKNLQVDTLWKDRLFSLSACSFSPDGTQLLVKGGPSAFGKTGENIGKNPMVNQYDAQLYIYDLATKRIIPITKDFNPSVETAVWHKNGDIFIKATDADFVHFYRYANGKITRMECPGDLVLLLSIAKDANRIMYTASGYNFPPRIYSSDLSGNTFQTWEEPQKQQYEHVVFGEMKDWDYNYKKGTSIDGRYYLPADFDPDKKYPLIVYYYGGTTPVTRTFAGRWPFNLYCANGYVVYVMQPSGAIGYGQEFSARHQNNWCKITAEEITASTKAFIKAHPFIDAGKVGCMGASYGGFTTEYLTTYTDIFACAISHAGISSISSYWGEGYWGYQYSTNASGHSYPWNRKDIYVDQSPLFNADKVKTPILLIHGTKDVNVPPGESIQFYTALKLLGKDAELVLVKDADHAVVDYKQRIIWNNTILSYFAKYLKGQPAWWENLYKDLNL